LFPLLPFVRSLSARFCEGRDPALEVHRSIEICPNDFSE
jgi:hypothetical protein